MIGGEERVREDKRRPPPSLRDTSTGGPGEAKEMFDCWKGLVLGFFGGVADLGWVFEGGSEA